MLAGTQGGIQQEKYINEKNIYEISGRAVKISEGGCNSILIQLQLFHLIKLQNFILIRYYWGVVQLGFHGDSQEQRVE